MPRKSLVVRLQKAFAPLAAAASASLFLAESASANWIAPEHGGSPNADAVHSLYVILLVVGLIVFFAVEGLLIYVLWRFRASRGHEAKQIHGNTTLEIGWTGGAAVIVVVLAIVSFFKLGEIRNPPNSDASGFTTTTIAKDPGTNQKLPPNGKALHIKVLGFQYGWQFTYDDGDGNPDNDVVAYRDMYVPTNTTVMVSITSRDVIHSWWIPELGGKFDAVNGFQNWTWFKVPADKAGTQFRGQCAELCGRGHANMTASAIAKTPAEFKTWLEDKKTEIDDAKAKAAEARKLVDAGETLK
ncbi:MAG: cytochrome c oxidase subunit II [Solirubrobacteraceae bacterium]|nr:cytochrome c oxidase subunit II [Solirubrobacteraceae bacterium]